MAIEKRRLSRLESLNNEIRSYDNEEKQIVKDLNNLKNPSRIKEIDAERHKATRLIMAYDEIVLPDKREKLSFIQENNIKKLPIYKDLPIPEKVVLGKKPANVVLAVIAIIVTFIIVGIPLLLFGFSSSIVFPDLVGIAVGAALAALGLRKVDNYGYSPEEWGRYVQAFEKKRADAKNDIEEYKKELINERESIIKDSNERMLLEGQKLEQRLEEITEKRNTIFTEIYDGSDPILNYHYEKSDSGIEKEVYSVEDVDEIIVNIKNGKVKSFEEATALQNSLIEERERQAEEEAREYIRQLERELKEQEEAARREAERREQARLTQELIDLQKKNAEDAQRRADEADRKARADERRRERAMNSYNSALAKLSTAESNLALRRANNADSSVIAMAEAEVARCKAEVERKRMETL